MASALADVNTAERPPTESEGGALEQAPARLPLEVENGLLHVMAEGGPTPDRAIHPIACCG